FSRDWSSDVCSSDLVELAVGVEQLVLEELGRRRETGGLSDLGLGDLDPAAAELLLEKPLQDELVPSGILDLPGLGSRDGLTLLRSEERRVGKRVWSA